MIRSQRSLVQIFRGINNADSIQLSLEILIYRQIRFSSLEFFDKLSLFKLP